jgi:hypothetical protein
MFKTRIFVFALALCAFPLYPEANYEKLSHGEKQKQSTLAGRTF